MKKHSEVTRRWQIANPEKHAANKRRASLKAYGITPEDYDRMLEEQGGRCAMCRTDDPGGHGGVKHFHVDHDHETGVVRGLLCDTCNRGLGTYEKLRILAETYLGRSVLA